LRKTEVLSLALFDGPLTVGAPSRHEEGALTRLALDDPHGAESPQLFGRFIVPAVLGPIKTDLHLSDGELGRINTIFMIGYFVSAPFFGYLGDRVSRNG